MSKPNGSGADGPITVQDLMQRIDGEIIDLNSTVGNAHSIDPEDLEDLLEAAGSAQRTVYPIVCPVVINDRNLVQSLAGQDSPASQLLLERIELLHVAANRAQPIFILKASSDGTWYGILANDGTQTACSTPRGSRAGDGALATMLRTGRSVTCIVAVDRVDWESLAACLGLERLGSILEKGRPATLRSEERSRGSSQPRVYIPE